MRSEWHREAALTRTRSWRPVGRGMGSCWIWRGLLACRGEMRGVPRGDYGKALPPGTRPLSLSESSSRIGHSCPSLDENASVDRDKRTGPEPLSQASFILPRSAAHAASVCCRWHRPRIVVRLPAFGRRAPIERVIMTRGSGESGRGSAVNARRAGVKRRTGRVWRDR